MKFLFNLLLIMGGLCGAAVSFSSTIVVNSSVTIINGLEFSVYLGAFSVVVLLYGVYNLISNNYSSE